MDHLADDAEVSEESWLPKNHAESSCTDLGPVTLGYRKDNPDVLWPGLLRAPRRFRPGGGGARGQVVWAHGAG